MTWHARVIGAVALCGSVWFAASAGAATIELALDLHPGFCPNLVNEQRVESLDAHVFGKSLQNIDLSTIRLYRPDGVGTSVAPISDALEENTSVLAAPPAIGCDCGTKNTASSRLALRFKLASVFESLGIDEDSLKEGVKLTVSGMFTDGTSFTASDCIGLLGAGDVNADGITDVADFGVMALHFGQGVSPGMDGDLDGDGDVDVFDFGRFVEAFSAP